LAAHLASHPRRSTITLRRSIQSDDSPTRLASELASARQAYETRKENVIGRVKARSAVITTLQEELRSEQIELTRVLTLAESGSGPSLAA
jgi:hypothetical protein